MFKCPQPASCHHMPSCCVLPTAPAGCLSFRLAHYHSQHRWSQGTASGSTSCSWHPWPQHSMAHHGSAGRQGAQWLVPVLCLPAVLTGWLTQRPPCAAGIYLSVGLEKAGMGPTTMVQEQQLKLLHTPTSSTVVASKLLCGCRGVTPCRPLVHCSATTPHDRDSCGAAHSPQVPSRTQSSANVLAALSDRPPSLADLLGPYFLVLNTPQVAEATLQVGLQAGARCMHTPSQRQLEACTSSSQRKLKAYLCLHK